jgi:antitoxin VapB
LLDPQAYALTYAYSAQGYSMSTSERHVRLFRNGRNQALRIPREFELEGEEAIIHKEGDRLIVEPVRKGKLLALLASLDSLTEPFPDIDDDLPPLDDVQL